MLSIILKVVVLLGAFITPVVAAILRILGKHTLLKPYHVATMVGLCSVFIMLSARDIERSFAELAGYRTEALYKDSFDDEDRYTSVIHYPEYFESTAHNLRTVFGLILVLLPYITWIILEPRVYNTGEPSKKFDTYARLGLVVMLILAIAPLPYWYYGIFRWIITITLIRQIKESHERGNVLLALASLAFALIYSPLWHLYIDKLWWQLIDGLCAIFLILTVAADYQKKSGTLKSNWLLQTFGHRNIDWREQQELNYNRIEKEAEKREASGSGYAFRSAETVVMEEVISSFEATLDDGEYRDCLYKPENTLKYPKSKISEAIAAMATDYSGIRKHVEENPENVDKILAELNRLRAALLLVIDTGDQTLSTNYDENIRMIHEKFLK